MEKNKIALILLLWCACGPLKAQIYSLKDLEVHFLENNTALIANKYNISKADAEIVQEKLWPNPNLAITDINLWKNDTADEQPYLFGKFGRYQQISFELQQLIETAGKRKKRISMKELSKQSALYDYEELMRALKKELRLSYYALERIHREELQLITMIDLFERLNAQYERQSALLNVRKADYFRIQTELLGLQKEQVELENAKHDALTNLRVLTNLYHLDSEQVYFSTSSLLLTSLLPNDLVELATTLNIDLLRQENEVNRSKGQLALEIAERTPNVTFQLNYDRADNIMKNFLGIGASMDIPVFNRNKGNIKAAGYEMEVQKHTQRALQSQLEQEIQKLLNQIHRIEASLVNWPNKQMEEQVLMIERYKKYLQNREVTLMEFIDFTQSYREAIQAYLQLQETYHQVFEELQYNVGKDF